MVNLLKFKPKAAYKDNRPSEISGRDAYMIYAKGVSKILHKYGGNLIFMGDVTFLALGKIQDGEIWDEIVIVEYPSRGHLLKMIQSSEWKALSVHRYAGLEGQLNIETVKPALRSKL